MGVVVIGYHALFPHSTRASRVSDDSGIFMIVVHIQRILKFLAGKNEYLQGGLKRIWESQLVNGHFLRGFHFVIARIQEVCTSIYST
ncbi:MAG TPA: hypothetical protein DD473_17830 [Planctomycetaceae bacterium]|nr:hypothetical protein [Planctomycetaceae bacterium]